MSRCIWILALWLQVSPALAAPSLDSIARIANDAAREFGPQVELEVVLMRIGEAYPELRRNYNLMQDSKSRQAASAEFPRVIANTEDARFVLTFNGDPNSAGYYEIEMYEFRAQPTTEDLRRTIERNNLPAEYQSEGFHFRRIIFAPRADYPYRASYADIATFPSVRPVNEPLCLGCHGKNPRPNWESYNLWEGTYFITDHRRIGKKYRLGYETPEHTAFDLFYSRQANKGRYRFLQGLDEQFLATSKSYARVAPSQFTQVAGYLNYRRLAHVILQSPDYQKFKYAIMGALYNCQDFETFFSEGTHRELKGELATYIQDTLKVFAADANYFFLEGDHEIWGKVRYIFEGRGHSMRKWSMNFRRAPYSFVTPGGMPEGFISTLLMETDPELATYRIFNLVEDRDYSITTQFSKTWTGSMTTMVAEECKLLQVKSREQL